jgi:hypothetical protein
MQVTINLPDKLIDRMQDKSGDLPQKILSALALSAFKEGSIDIDELKDMLHLGDDAGLMEFLKKNNMLHAGGIINLYGSCADIDFANDELGISDEMDDELMVNFDD